ncbi:FG-GAP-like repeat-containing protein [Kitasatospora purpeofusca]|uniref:FG-GAP-like repeat-containing protein n=1 Tax=Kitasatospora purpeofusca TaxID=67352 RepID=UPI0036D3AB73
MFHRRQLIGLVAAVGATVAVMQGVTTAAAAATAANTGAPSAAEDGAYPGADRILAETGATVVRGDGRITVTDCANPYQIKVWARTVTLHDNWLCFAATGPTGYLAVNIPEAYRVQTVERDVKASLSTNGQAQSIDVPRNTAKGFGEASPTSGLSTLLELRVTGSSAAPATGQPADPATAFTAHLAVGDQGRTCTGALVDPRWVLTAKSCFADDPANPGTVTAGAPKQAATATIGRSDLAATGGQQVRIAELVPHQDRDLVMARLDTPVFDIAPVALSGTAPAEGGALTTAGFGRTATAWTPGTLHTSAVTAGTVTATGLDVTPTTPGLICKGDAGGPVWRTENAKPVLTGVISRSWQGGCLGTPATETRTGAHETRVDDLGPWITALRDRRSAAVNEAGTGRLRFTDFDADGKPDYLTVEDNGAVKVWLNRGGDPAGGAGWQGLGQVATGVTTDRSRVRLADFNGDGKADYIVVNPDGSVDAWLNHGGDQVTPWEPVGRIATGVTNRQDQVRFADFDGDGRADYLVIEDNGAVKVWLNRGGDPAGGAGWQGLGQVATGVTTDRSRVRLADFNGDGKADYIVVAYDGSVNVWLNHGGDQVTPWESVGRVAAGLTTDNNGVFLTDFTGDGRADYLWNPGDGSTSAYANKGGDGHGGWDFLGRIASGA